MAVKSAELKRTTVRLPEDALSKLEKLAQEQGITLTAALQKAIATEDYVRGEIKKGGKILVEKPNHTFSEVVFR
jgi:predicted DNA-binding protein